MADQELKQLREQAERNAFRNNPFYWRNRKQSFDMRHIWGDYDEASPIQNLGDLSPTQDSIIIKELKGCISSMEQRLAMVVKDLYRKNSQRKTPGFTGTIGEPDDE